MSDWSAWRMRAYWFAINTAWWGLAAADILGGHEWAGNAFAFLTVALLVLTLFFAAFGTLFAVLADDESVAEVPDRKIPAGWSWTYDLLGMTLIASAGWFWLASAVFVQACAQHWTWACLQSAKESVT